VLDVLVLGAGPSGLAAAAALCEGGLAVGCLSPGGLTPWPNTYGVWTDEVAPLGYAPLLARTWDRVAVQLGRGEVELGRTYGRFDNTKLQAHLVGRCERGGLRWLRGEAGGAYHDGRGTTVYGKDGSVHCARLVVDSSGHLPALVTRPPRPSAAFQTAYGVLGTFSAPPIAEGQMMLMDYRDDFLAGEADPTFLYAMDLGGGVFFLEETSLARRPALPYELLRDRLHRRLEHLGVRVGEVLGTEHCRFPMGLPLPHRGRVVGFGGAASMVHPASGYMIATALRTAPELAGTLARELGRVDADLERSSQAAWDALWSPARVRQRNLYLFGLEALLKLGSAQLRDFFTSFFELPPERWQGYLSGTLTLREQLAVMAAVFRRASPRVRAPLLKTAAGPGGGFLLRALRP